MTKKPASFAKRFLWGAGTSAHQVEGGTHNTWSVWELENAKALAAKAVYQYEDLPSWEYAKRLAMRPENYISGRAVDHFNRYEEDFDLLASLNMNAYRFSIEWSRIEPQEGAWDVEAIAHYKRYIEALKARGIEPVVTLFHFTLPVWFAELGGFERRRNIQYFVRYVEKVMEELGVHLRYVLTINEPNVYALKSYYEGAWTPNVRSKFKFWRVLNNLATAHRQAAARIRAIRPRVKVSLAYNSTYVYAGDDAWLSRTTASLLQYVVDDYFLKKVYKRCDFLGVNYYLSMRVYGYRVHNPHEATSDLGWDVSPDNIEHELVRLHDKYKLPILITENGIADAQDAMRKKWLEDTIRAMLAAQQDGAELIGYLHWSLLDNIELADGRWPRFGLVEVNYATMERTVRPSAVWFGKVIKKLRKV